MLTDGIEDQTKVSGCNNCTLTYSAQFSVHMTLDSLTGVAFLEIRDGQMFLTLEEPDLLYIYQEQS